MNFPNVWPDGGLFVFSGLDGETSWRHPFHAVPVVGPVGFDLYAADTRNHVHRVASLSLPREHGPGPISGAVILNDAAHLPSGAGGPETIVAWLDRRTLVGWAKTGKPSLSTADGSSLPLDTSGVARLALPDVGVIVLHLGPDGRFALAYDEQSDQAALDRARAGIDASPHDLLVARAAYQAALATPDDLSPDEERLVRKAAAVLKANVESPQGAIARRWTTPDRLPHRNMWLWDSAFHALGLVYFDPALAQDAILAPLSRLRPDGMLAHMMAPDSDLDSDITQPPILAWAAWKVYQSTRDTDFLEAVYDPAARYLTWDLEHRVLRDSTAADLLGWLIDDDPLCRCGESGLDNSPRFDDGDISGAVDFSAEAALEAECLAHIAHEIGRTADAER